MCDDFLGYFLHKYSVCRAIFGPEEGAANFSLSPVAKPAAPHGT